MQLVLISSEPFQLTEMAVKRSEQLVDPLSLALQIGVSRRGEGQPGLTVRLELRPAILGEQ